MALLLACFIQQNIVSILDVKDLNVNPKPLGLTNGKETLVKSRAHPPGAIFGLFLGKTTPEAVRAAAESPADPEAGFAVAELKRIGP